MFVFSAAQVQVRQQVLDGVKTKPTHGANRWTLPAVNHLQSTPTWHAHIQEQGHHRHTSWAQHQRHLITVKLFLNDDGHQLLRLLWTATGNKLLRM